MLTKDEAKKLVEDEINRPDPSMPDSPELVIIDEGTIEREFGWVFFYDTRKSVETGDSETSLLGNAPYIVNKHDGSLHETGTAYPIEHYIENYERTGIAEETVDRSTDNIRDFSCACSVCGKPGRYHTTVNGPASMGDYYCDDHNPGPGSNLIQLIIMLGLLSGIGWLIFRWFF